LSSGCCSSSHRRGAWASARRWSTSAPSSPAGPATAPSPSGRSRSSSPPAVSTPAPVTAACPRFPTPSSGRAWWPRPGSSRSEHLQGPFLDWLERLRRPPARLSAGGGRGPPPARAERAPGRRCAWDAGCGSGQLSAVLGDVFERVEATDASAAQIAAAVPHPHVHYAVSPAEHVDLSDRSVDCAVAAQAAHWFDLEAYYRGVRRVLRPQGLVALATYALMNITPEVDRIVYRFYWGPLDGYWPPERRLVEEGYRSVPFPFTELQPPALMLEQRWDLGQVVGYIGTWSAVQALKKAGKGSELDRLVAELQDASGDPATVRDGRWPLPLKMGKVEG